MPREELYRWSEPSFKTLLRSRVEEARQAHGRITQWGDMKSWAEGYYHGLADALRLLEDVADE